MDDNKLHKIEPHTADANADVVFVHGLGGDHRETWMARCDDDETYWPSWVANDFPTVNVWSLAYPSQPSGWTGDGVELDTLLDSLLDYLALMGIGQRPVILITHSLGGLVAKGVLRAASDAGDQRLKMIASNIRGVAFLATPHTGSGLASFASRFLGGLLLTRVQPILRSLRANSAQLEKLNDWYRKNSVSMGIKSLVYREGKRTGFFRIVNATSGHPGLPDVRATTINRDHFTVCKPPSRDDQVYLGVRQFIEECLTNPPNVAPPGAVSPREPAMPAAPSMATPVQPHVPLAAPRLPLPPKLFGRDEELNEIVAALLDDNDSPIAVLGQAGIGKSALTLAALQSAQVTARFGNRRWFVRLETATEARAIWTSILAALADEPGPQPDAQTLALLCTAPGALVLDNGETPWDADRVGTEAAFAALSAVSQLKLIVSIRGQQSPYGPVWRRIPAVMERLAPEDAKALFLSLAGPQMADDPQLDALLQELDGLPLAIRLIAHLAQGEQNIAGLLDDYRARRKSPSIGTGKDQNLAASIQLSLDSPRLDDPARRLFVMIGRLPAGLADAHADALIAGGRAAARSLRQVGIAMGDADGRTRLLAPIRQDAADRPLSDADELALAAHYFGLAKHEGEKIGAAGGREAIAQLLPEIGNFENLVRLAAGVEAESPCVAMANAARGGAHGLAELMRFSGIGSAEMVRHLASIARASGDTLGEARCIAHLGHITSVRSDHTAARAAYEKALPLYRQVGNTLGEADCIKSLGDIELERSDHVAARAAFDEALLLYRKVGNELGEANCIQSLGDLELERSDHIAARAACEEALPLYRQIGNKLGEANCIKSLGDIALRRSDHVAARAAYDEALPLYRQVGDRRGEASCIENLGDIALARSDHVAARVAYDEALTLYRQVGSKLGEANCILSLGDIELDHSDHVAARAAYEEALSLYLYISEPFSIGQTHRRLAHITDSKARLAHIAAAREAWGSIGRDDLIAALNEDFS